MPRWTSTILKPRPAPFAGSVSPAAAKHPAIAFAAAKLGLSRFVLYGLAASLSANALLAAALLVKKPVVTTVLIPSPVFDPIPSAWSYDEAGPSEALLSYFAQKLVGWRTNLHAGAGAGVVASFLQHAAPESAEAFRQAFEAERAALEKDNAASAFFPLSTTVDRRALTVVVQGRQKTIIGTKVVADRPAAYRLAFEYRAGRILLTAMESVAADDPSTPTKRR